ncbi:MAG: electron transport complex subunit E, partial [Peptostreptococcus sp.]|nr:electron transport complex subunit E [Peptostreptococcus sp.]
MSNLGKIFKNGIIDENPTFVQVIGMCPTLAVTSSAINGIGMGLSTAVVLACSNLAISLLRKIVPDKIRIPCFVVVIATFVTIVQMLLKAYVPALDKALGLYIPLIVVNCLILARAESFACKNKPFPSLVDGFAMGLGFTIALTILGAVREILGAGSVFGVAFLPETFNTLLFILPPGAFLT